MRVLKSFPCDCGEPAHQVHLSLFDDGDGIMQVVAIHERQSFREWLAAEVAGKPINQVALVLSVDVARELGGALLMWAQQVKPETEVWTSQP